jgi:glycosyltransferase involved in cell wall biosynthesis
MSTEVVTPLRSDPSFSASAVEGKEIQISVVMPCLNEEASIGRCVDKAIEGIRRTGLCGEVVVCDNGSTDRSAEIAAAHGARVVHQAERGYGHAYRAGFEAARGRYLLMGDADETYDFTQLDRFVELLQQGYDYVLGSRFAGEIQPGAMPWLHRYVGNPVLTWILNHLFGLNASDAHSGMRAFTREAYDRMHLQTTGMEFASEIVINAAKSRLKTAEVPIAYYPRLGDSKLDSVRDGWRHLRFMLLHSPDYLFLLPGLVFLLAGLAGSAWVLPGPQYVRGRVVDIHFMILFALLAILGAQTLAMGLSAKAYAFTHHFVPTDEIIERFYRHFSLERGLLIASILGGAGFLIDLNVLIIWLMKSLGELNAVRPALFGSTLMVLGAQIAFGSCLLAILDINEEARRRARAGRDLPEPGQAATAPRSSTQAVEPTGSSTPGFDGTVS